MRRTTFVNQAGIEIPERPRGEQQGESEESNDESGFDSSQAEIGADTGEENATPKSI